MSRADAEALAAQRAAARDRRDFAAADSIRAHIAALGFILVDTADGWFLEESPVPAGESSSARSVSRVWPDASADGSDLAAGARILATVLVTGWRADADACVRALLAHEPASTHVAVVTVGDDDGIAAWATEMAHRHADRVTAIHLGPDAGHWGAIHRALIARCAAEFIALVDSATVVTGPALTACCDVIVAGGLAAAGWRGADVDLADQWRSVTSADGAVDVLLSYLMVVPTPVAQAAPPSPKARFYRNADLEWSLRIRQWWAQEHRSTAVMTALGDALPATQGRHHGYHDTDADYRDKQSRATYNRILQSFRGREEILRDR